MRTTNDAIYEHDRSCRVSRDELADLTRDRSVGTRVGFLGEPAFQRIRFPSFSSYDTYGNLCRPLIIWAVKRYGGHGVPSKPEARLLLQ